MPAANESTGGPPKVIARDNVAEHVVHCCAPTAESTLIRVMTNAEEEDPASLSEKRRFVLPAVIFPFTEESEIQVVAEAAEAAKRKATEELEVDVDADLPPKLLPPEEITVTLNAPVVTPLLALDAAMSFTDAPSNDSIRDTVAVVNDGELELPPEIEIATALEESCLSPPSAPEETTLAFIDVSEIQRADAALVGAETRAPKDEHPDDPNESKPIIVTLTPEPVAGVLDTTMEETEGALIDKATTMLAAFLCSCK